MPRTAKNAPTAPRLTLVVPCFNEEEMLPITIEKLSALMAELVRQGTIQPESQVLLVNDGSRDHTWELIEACAEANPMFAGLSLSRNFGHQYALLAGLHNAPGDAVISLDADLQDDLDAIPKMIACYREGADVVYGVRDDRSTDTFFKRATALTFYRLMGWLGARTVANHADYRLMSRRALEALRSYEESSLYLRGLIPFLGFQTATVTYKRRERQAGETKYPLRKMIALAVSAVTSHSSYPLRLITFGAVAGLAIVAAIAFWVAYVRFFEPERSAPGWASILLPVLSVGFLNLLAVGVTGEYLARIFDEVKRRPRYIIASRLNLED